MLHATAATWPTGWAAWTRASVNIRMAWSAAGLDRSLLHRVSEQQLLEDCGIHLGVHRARILTAARGQPAHLGP